MVLLLLQAAVVCSTEVIWKLHDDGLEVVMPIIGTTSGTSKVTLNANFLRDRCLSPRCVDPDSLQPNVLPHEQPAPHEFFVSNVTQVVDEPNKVLVTFSDGVEADYSLPRLMGK